MCAGGKAARTHPDFPRLFEKIQRWEINIVSKQVPYTARELNPANLMRSGYYFRESSCPEKANAYLAYLVEKYPWSDEADMALEELRKQ